MMEARRNATVRARTPSVVVEVSAKIFQETLISRPQTAIALIRTVWDRLQSAESHLVQHQKMAALGTLAAGLAHELNNPAAALIRSTGQLEKTLAEWEKQSGSLGGIKLSSSEIDAIGRIMNSFENTSNVGELDPLARSDLEDTLVSWLEEQSG